MTDLRKIALIAMVATLACDSNAESGIEPPELPVAALSPGLECAQVERRRPGLAGEYLLSDEGASEQYLVSYSRAPGGRLQRATIDHTGPGTFRRITLNETQSWITEAVLANPRESVSESEDRGPSALRSEAAALVRALVRRVEKDCRAQGG